MANIPRIIETPWESFLEPVKIFGNLYFVGTVAASTHILKTEDGLIMFDSGYHETLYMVINNMYKLGLDPQDLKLILHTHGHIDHFGATPALLHMTDAKAGVPELDKTYVTDEENLSWADELLLPHRPFTPNFTYKDGDVIEFGGSKIKCILTPGHTPGTTTFLFDVTDGTSTYTACLIGGVGMNTMQPGFLEKYGLSSSTKEAFPSSMDILESLEVDILLGNHVGNNNTDKKIEAIKSGNPNAFIVKDENKSFAIEMKEKYWNLFTNKK